MTILLIPPPGDALGLLAPGRHGARVPVMYSGWLCGHASHVAWSEKVRDDCYMCRGDIREALVLADSEGPEPIGFGRAALVFATVEGSGPIVSANLRRGDQNIAEGTGRWWLEWFEQSKGDTGFAGGAVYGRNRSYGDFGGDRHVALPRPAGIGDGSVLDARALATLLVSRYPGAEVVVLP